MWPFKKKKIDFPDISKEFSKKNIPDLGVPMYKKEPVLGAKLDIPMRKKAPTMPKKFDYLKKDVLLPKMNLPYVEEPIEEKIMPKKVEVEKGHIFVEIEDYKVVLSKVELIKEKIKDAEKIVDELNKIRAKEERELENWHKDIEGIKVKLMEIDSKLFKV